MKDPNKTVEYKGYNIEIHNDEWPYDPRKECDNLGKVITKCWYNESPLGNDELDRETVECFISNVENHGGVVLPIYRYSHGIDRYKTTSFHGCGLPQGHARFDSGLAGYIYVTAETIRKEYGKQRISQKLKAKVEKVLEGEVQTMDDYSCGNVWGYVLTDSKTGEEIDSCWGYFGDDEYPIEDAKAIVDSIMRKPFTRQPVIEMLGA